VQAGQRGSAVLDAYPDWRIPSEVLAIIPTADRQKATVRVRIGFLERDQRILRDMGAKVSFLGALPANEEPEIQGVLIAGEALQTDAGGDFVWLVRNGTVERRSVIIGGPRDRQEILVSSGIVAGDILISRSERALVAGQAVRTNN
jgi:multidrug efflux pump subunit AcrA (membrane-fusion protein)